MKNEQIILPNDPFMVFNDDNARFLNPPNYPFSIFQTCILVAFLKGLSFYETATSIGMSLAEFYPTYAQILKITGARNKKELITIAKKMKIFGYLFNKDGRMKRDILNN